MVTSGASEYSADMLRLMSAALVVTVLLGCGFRQRQDEKPMGELPDAVTSAVPQWIPFRIQAGSAVERDPREAHLFNLRQLTSDGASRSAVWHPDGRSIVFERGACGQLYRMILETGETTRVSPETGWASAAAYQNGELLFAYSSDTSACERGPVRWSLPESDIWSSNGAFIKGPNYDGELDASAEGIVFTSTRKGDADIYVAAADGSDATPIASAAGYEGGARFSPDGSKLVWHASSDPVKNAPDAPDAPNSPDKGAALETAAPDSCTW